MSYLLLEVLLLLADILAFVLPIALVARNILQVFIVVYMFLAHNVRGTLDNRFRQANLTRNLHGKTTTGLTDRELEEGFELSAVIEHSAINDTLGTLSHVLEIAVVGSHHAKSALLIERRKNSFGNRTTNHRFGTSTKLINEQKGMCIGIAHKMLHVSKVRRVGREVVLNGLLVTYINEQVLEEAHLTCLTHGDWQTALYHVLQYRYRLEADGLTTCVRSTNDQYAVIGDWRLAIGKVNGQRNDGLALTAEIE